MTKLVTCDSQVSSLAAALNSASPADKAALAAALAAAGVGGGAPTGAAGGALNGTYPNPGLDAAALKAAVAASGVGTGAFIAQTAGVALPNSTETTLASWTATRTGVIAVSFSFAAATSAGTKQLLSVAKIYKGATQVAASGNSAGDSDTETRNSFAEATVQYLPVVVGDVITGKGFAGADPATGSTTVAVAGVGLSLHYISVA